ncbi:hypothetical protein BCR42DRAFT_431992 [Absidia repens]|uniref:SWR1-complex protein 4 n=1 Tax=Absidia repens TaxID=90262 RepID=A0A1X2IXQ2_9FUNG|nr:hypothetical protein BCR42DRAFT_431992 [Absidia repens]
MSGSDIRDILQLGKRSETPQQRKPKPATEKRPEKYNREVFSLTGGLTPSAFVPPTYKAKFNAKKKSTPWVLQSFQNPARSDHLELQHWVKANYPFARYEKQSNIVQYTDKEYEKYLKDHTWTKEETDYLIDLCKQYHLRFQVIADRYQFDPKRHRSIDDLKERYSNIQQKLHKAEGKGVSAPLATFDKARELERKHALRILYNRTKEEEQEEAELLTEVKRIEQNQAKLAKERENLQELLRQHQLSITASNKKRATSSTGSKEKKKKRKSSNDKKELATEDLRPGVTEKLTPGVYVRSQKLPVMKTSIQPKVIKVLNELSIGTRPMMPTASVCESFERLENSIVTLFELKKVVDKMEIEHRVEKKQDIDDHDNSIE